MAYAQKYYANVPYEGHGLVQLVIQEKDYSGPSYVIGNIQSLTLEVGGGNEPPYTPIVKTTLRFSMADAFDVGSTVDGVTCVTVEGQTRTKHGQWEEFYTNDATKYKVQLVYLLSGTGRPVRSTVFWQGLITPDSWQESMVYRGSITVVARDMLGSLADITFDAESADGRISVGELIQKAIQRCEAPMGVTLNAQRALRNIDADLSIFAAQVWISSLEGKSWWAALTETMEALGLIMRYTGNGGWTVTSLRYLPQVLGIERHGCEFINRSGVRTLDPPVREISAEYTVEFTEPALDAPEAAALDTSELVLTRLTGDGGTSITLQVQSYEPGSASGGWDAGEATAQRPSLMSYPGPADASLAEAGISLAPLYFIANSITDAGKKRYGNTPTVQGFVRLNSRLIIRQDGAILTRDTNGYMRIPVIDDNAGTPYIKTVAIYITGKSVGGQLYHYTGAGVWVTGSEKETEADADGIEPLVLALEAGSDASVDIYPSDTVSINAGTIRVSIANVDVGCETLIYTTNRGFFVPLAISIGEPESSTTPTEYSVKTIYNEEYNVRIDRSPSIISTDTALPARILANVLQLNGSALPNSWNWPDTAEGYPLEVMVQAQVLQFYAASFSIFTGSIHDKTFPVAVPGTYYEYYDRWCILQRGTFDFRTGYIMDASLREYMTWEQVWQSFAPQYTEQGRRGSGGSGSRGGSGGGGGSASVVNSISERVTALESLIGEDEDHNAYVKPYGDAARELKNAGGVHARNITLARSTAPSGTADLEVITYTDEHDVVHEYLHTRLPFASDADISAGGRGSGGGGGGGGTSVLWGGDAQNGYETLVVEGYTGNQRRVALSGHLHAVADIFAGIGTSTPSVGDTLVYGQNGWSYGAAGAVTSVVGLTGAITQAQLSGALGLGDAANKDVATAITWNNTDLVTAKLVYQYVEGIISEVDELSDDVEALASAMADVLALIPSAASPSNLLADRSWVLTRLASYALESEIPTHLGDLAETTTGTGSWHFTTEYKNRLDALEEFLDMFELLGAGTSASPYVIHALYPLYSDGYIAAGGRGSGGGGGGGATYLGQLEDVTLTNPSHRQVLWRNSSGAWVNHTLAVADISDLGSTLGNYVTVAGEQTITGAKTFTPQATFTNGISSGHVLPRATDAYDLGSSSYEWQNLHLNNLVNIKGNNVLQYNGSVLLVGYGLRDLAPTQFYAPSWHFRTKIAGASEETVPLSIYQGSARCRVNFLPGEDGGVAIGSSSAAWDAVHARRWYPVPGNTSLYVEYNSTYEAFYFNGNIVASGYIAAGGRGPNT